MPLLKSDHASALVNKCSAEVINKIHFELCAQTLGNALVIGNQVALLLPLPSQSKSLTAVSIISKRLINEKRFPALYEFDYLVRDDLTDEHCLAMDQNLKDFNFVKIPHWNRWIIEYFQSMDESAKLSKLIALLDSGDEHKLDDFMRAVKGC